MTRKINIAFATNDPRSNYLSNALEKIAHVQCIIQYDPISPFLKYPAALLSFSRNRRDWWNSYQWHPLMQLGRKRRLFKKLAESRDKCDILLMWSSWFNPERTEPGGGLPFYVYHDQSCSPFKEEGELGKNTLARKKFNVSQNHTLHHAHGIFCMSTWTTQQTLRAHKLPKNKVHTVGWGPCSINMLDEPINIPQNDPIVLFVGHEFYRKGVDILRGTVPRVIDKVPSTKFLVIGANSNHFKIEPHPALTLAGMVNDEEVMKQYFREASVFVLPHRFERAGHVLAEAMSAGKPIVTSNQGGPTDAVIDGETGFVISVGDTDALSSSLIKLLTNHELSLKLGTAGRNLMQEKFTWGKVAQKMVQIIEEDLDYTWS